MMGTTDDDEMGRLAKMLGGHQLTEEEANRGKWAPQLKTHTDLDRQKMDKKFDKVFELSEAENDLEATLRTKSILIPPGNVQGPCVVNVLQPPLLPLRKCLRLLGVMPFTVEEEQYLMRWKSIQAIHTMINAAYLTILMVTTAVGIVITFTTPQTHDTPQDANIFSIKILVVVLIVGQLVNAWSQVLNALYAGRRMCRLLNNWNSLVAATKLDPTKGLGRTARLQMVFLVLMAVIMLLMTLLRMPQVIVYGLDGVEEIVLLVPTAWLNHSPMLTQFLHVVTCVVCLHLFSIFKGSLFSFTTNCHMLKNALASWNSQLKMALEDLWSRRDRQRGRLGLLVQSHYQLVRLVRETEAIFGPMLQCYYGSTVIILCTELYLLAYRLGSDTYAADGVVTTALMTLQTTAVFIQVSLSAAAVQEVAEESVDILRRGIPFDTSDRDKFNRDELTTSVTGSEICITGGKFFVINRPFIITVLSAVITYFIVMIQFMQSSLKSPTMAPPPAMNETPPFNLSG